MRPERNRHRSRVRRQVAAGPRKVTVEDCLEEFRRGMKEGHERLCPGEPYCAITREDLERWEEAEAMGLDDDLEFYKVQKLD